MKIEDVFRFPDLQLLKLGGSLITDKSKPHTARPGVIRRLVQEIRDAREENPALQLLLGHGSGSFGHVPAKRYGTRRGVRTAEEWHGFREVWKEAQALNLKVMDILDEARIPALVFPPLASVVAEDGVVLAWNLTPIARALQAGLLPVVYGDAVFDQRRGGTILSTEELFAHLAKRLQPRRILLAGLEPGVWADYPNRTEIIPQITSENMDTVMPAVKAAAGTDVTGGMASKVGQSLDLVMEIPGLEVAIFSGEHPGTLKQALVGERPGTLIVNRFASQ